MTRLALHQSFRLSVVPTPKRRARSRIIGGRVVTYTPQDSEDTERTMRAMLSAAEPLCYPRGVPVALRVTFFVQRPKDTPRREQYTPRRPDLPNYLMLVCDVGTGVLWADDSQIVTIDAAKELTDGTPGLLLVTGVPMTEQPVNVHARMAWETWVLDREAALIRLYGPALGAATEVGISRPPT